MANRNWIRTLSLLVMLTVHISCNSQHQEREVDNKKTQRTDDVPTKTYDSSYKTIHILVALCDNKYQGIVPVPASIGNGQHPNTNLYWGSAYGIKNYFKKSKNWSLVEVRKTYGAILERAIFKHKKKKYYLVADAYNGKLIKQTTIDFLNNSCGYNKDTIRLENRTIGVSGNAQLLSYIGHDGLMDFKLDADFKNKDGISRDVMILACYSKHYSSVHLQHAHVQPLLWTTGLMAPEAYTIHDALEAYINKSNNETIRLKGAMAYSKYQKCGLKAAKRLLQTGW